MTRRRWLLAGLCALGGVLTSSAPVRGQSAPTGVEGLPRVLILATGGTIATRASGRLSARELVGRLPPAAGHMARLTHEQFSNVSSTSLTLRQYVALARRVDARFSEDPSLAGIVVTTGTDAMEELAYFLHLAVRHAYPVVVTGAMKNASDALSDGPANLLAGIQVAADPASVGRGVLVVMHGEVHGARDVVKVDTTELDAFVSANNGPLGTVTSEGVTFLRPTGRRHGVRSEFDAERLERLPRVDVVLTYQGAPSDVIKTAVDGRALGLVVAGAGAGSLSGAQLDGLRYARAHGVAVVRASRTLRGTVTIAQLADPDGQPNSDGHVAAGDLSAVKSRILLMLALTTTRDAHALQRMFDEY
jgi:L-asparaginase